MTTRSKRRLLYICLCVFFLVVACLWLTHSTPQSRFQMLFSDMSIGVPEYQTIRELSLPDLAKKGDHFKVEVTESYAQFTRLITKLGVAEDAVLSQPGVSDLKVTSKLNPRYPWFLSLKAEAVDTPDKTYKMHLEGRQ